MNVQALFSKHAAASDRFMDDMRRIPDFPDHELTREELASTELPGFLTVGGRTLLRWEKNGFAVTVLYNGDPQDVRVDILDKLDGWHAKDERYETRLRLMEGCLERVAAGAGLTPRHLALDDPGVALCVQGLNRAYGAVPQSLQGKDEEHLAVVAMQGLGADPFIRCFQR